MSALLYRAEYVAAAAAAPPTEEKVTPRLCGAKNNPPSNISPPSISKQEHLFFSRRLLSVHTHTHANGHVSSLTYLFIYIALAQHTAHRARGHNNVVNLTRIFRWQEY